MTKYDRARKATVLLNKYLRGEIQLSEKKIKFYSGLVVKASLKSFYFFSKYVLNFNLLTEQTHKKWCDKFQSDFWVYNFLMRLKPRKTFKTTIYAEALILWLWAVISPQLHIFYTSANGTLLQEVSTHLDYFLESDNNNLYSFVFGVKRDSNLRPNTSDTFNIVGKDRSVKGSSLMFRTAGGSVNGIHPHVIIIDDPMDKNDRESPTIRKKKEFWFDSLFPLLHPFKHKIADIMKIVFISTRWHMDDLVNHVIKLNNKIEDDEDKFDIESEGVYLPDGSPRYPEFFGKKAILKIKAFISDVFFACQYLNNPLPEGMMVFNKKKMHFYEPATLDITKGRNICILDPAKGKTIESDYPAVVWANYHENTLSFFDAIDTKMPLDDLLKLVAKKNIDYKIPEMVYESNGTMLLNKTIIQAHLDIDKNCKIMVVEINENRNKDDRIVNMQPNLYNDSVRFRADYKTKYPEMMNQIVFYPAWGNDDFPDVVEKVVGYVIFKSIQPVRPSDVSLASLGL